ncbi:hypothetical protein AB1Y20_008708 [Prymnesium parvum]|uniref:Rab3 GTPase-activating protein catalytic subunit n=1 Tax=Prymnesium parvum TaxID=97485 RepID=A0AB34IU28_PRYPA
MSDSESDGEAQFQRWLARKQGTEPARPRAYDDRAQKDATAAHRPEKKSPGSNCREGRTALDPAAVEYDSAAVCAGPGPAETGEERARGEEACGGCGNGLAGQEVREEFPGSETLEAERGSSLAAHVTEAGGGEFAGRSGAAEQREEVVLEVEILLETQRGDDEVPRVDAVVGNRPAAERRDGVAPQTAVVVPPVESPLEPPCGGEVPQGGVAGEVGSATPSEEELLVPATRITTAEREGGSSPPPAAEAGGSARFSVRSRVRAFMEKAATHTFLPTEATEPDGMVPSCCVSTADERSSALPLIDVASSLDDLERRAHEAMRPWLEDEDEASEFSMWRSRGGWAEELDEYSPHLPPLPPTPSAAEQSRWQPASRTALRCLLSYVGRTHAGFRTN